MGKKDLNQLRDGDEFVAYAKKRGAEIRQGAGSHTIVKTDKGACVVPCGHTEELGKGLRLKIVKVFIAIGLGCGVVLTIAVYF